MSRKKRKQAPETTIENYYDLRIDKVNELVAALKDEDAEFEDEVNYGINTNTGINDPKNIKRSGKEKQFDPYKTDFLAKIPVWIKAFFVKFWFAGAVAYFVTWGIGLGNTLDSLVLTGAVLGLVVDVLVNPLFRYMETDRKEYNAYMMFPFPFKQFWTFFTNILYYIVVLIFVNYCYFGMNEFINYVKGTSDVIAVGVEPLLFGAFCVVADMIFIGIKDGIVALIRHLKKKKKEGMANA